MLLEFLSQKARDKTKDESLPGVPTQVENARSESAQHTESSMDLTLPPGDGRGRAAPVQHTESFGKDEDLSRPYVRTCALETGKRGV